MAGDVKLDQDNVNWVTIEGTALRARTPDFMLDSQNRRSGGGGTWRRALVHDQSDGLTINYNSDYPGGVTLKSVTSISPHGTRSGGALANRISTRNVAELVIEGGIQFLWDNGPQVRRPGMQPTEAVSLQSILAGLQQEIGDLQLRVAALEKK